MVCIYTFLTGVHSKQFTILLNIHPFIHTFTHQRQCQPRMSTASSTSWAICLPNIVLYSFFRFKMVYLSLQCSIWVDNITFEFTTFYLSCSPSTRTDYVLFCRWTKGYLNWDDLIEVEGVLFELESVLGRWEGSSGFWGPLDQRLVKSYLRFGMSSGRGLLSWGEWPVLLLWSPSGRRRPGDHRIHGPFYLAPKTESHKPSS